MVERQTRIPLVGCDTAIRSDQGLITSSILESAGYGKTKVIESEIRTRDAK